MATYSLCSNLAVIYWPWKPVLRHFCMPVRGPMLLHRMALVSFRLFCKNLGNLQEFFGQMVYRPPWPKIARTPMYKLIQSRCVKFHVLGWKNEEYSPQMFFLFMRKLYFKKSKNFFCSFIAWARIETTFIEMTSWKKRPASLHGQQGI